MGLMEIAAAIKDFGLAGTAAIFIWLYIDERKASRESAAKTLEWMLKATEASINMTNSLTSLKDTIKDQ